MDKGNPRLVLCAFFVAAVGCAGGPAGSAGDGSNYYGGDPAGSGGDTGSTDGSASQPGGGDTGSGDTGGGDTGSGDTGGGNGSGSSSIPQGLTAPPSCAANYHDVYSP